MQQVILGTSELIHLGCNQTLTCHTATVKPHAWGQDNDKSKQLYSTAYSFMHTSLYLARFNYTSID